MKRVKRHGISGRIDPMGDGMKRIMGIFILLFLSVSLFSLTVSGPSGGAVRSKPFDLLVQDAPYLMKILYNGIPIFAKAEGSFQRTMLASRGWNQITVADADNLKNSDSVAFFADVPPTTLKVILYWDTDNTDLDLHVIEPDGTECYYGYRETTLGGKLDVDVTTGYGPEIYVMEFPNPGEYSIFVYYYGGEELTEATAVTVMYEGTAREKRQTFQLMLTQPGRQVFLGKIKVE